MPTQAPTGSIEESFEYAESFHDAGHLGRLIAEAQQIVDAALAGP
jgi:hypothetical protein